MARFKRHSRLLTLSAAFAMLVALPAGVMMAGTNPFTDVSESAWYYNDVMAIYNAGVTGGCTPTKYCPDKNVTRAEMAAFLNRVGALGSGKTPVANAATARSTDGWSLGCPANTTSSQGLCFDNAIRGNGGIYEASDACAAINTGPFFGGHRWFLPGANQLRSAAAVAGLGVTTVEWSSDMWIDSTDGWSGLAVSPFLGGFITARFPAGNDYDYRCATYPLSWDGITIIFPEDQGGPVGQVPDSDAAARAQMDYLAK